MNFVPGLQPLGCTFQEEGEQRGIDGQCITPAAGLARRVECSLWAAPAVQLQTCAHRLPAGVCGVDNLSDARPSRRRRVDSGCYLQDVATLYEAARLRRRQDAVSVRWRFVEAIWQDVFVLGRCSVGSQSYSGYSVRNDCWNAVFHRICCVNVN